MEQKRGYATETQGQIAIVRLKGDFNVFFTKGLSERISDLADQGIRAFLFELKNSQWIDSLGVRDLILAAHCSAHHGRKVGLLDANPNVRLVLEKLDVTSAVRYYDNKAEAIADFDQILS